MSQPSYTLPVGVRVIKITRGDVSRHGEQSGCICKKYSDQMNFNEVYTRGVHTATVLGIKGGSKTGPLCASRQQDT